MKTLLALLVFSPLLAFGALTPDDFILIGSPANPPDRNGRGTVAKPFRITRERISNAQYAEFLNQVDPDGKNERGLYRPLPDDAPGGITFDPDQPAGKHYQVSEMAAREPYRFARWVDAARYANWLSNGATPDSGTETGAYDLLASKGERTPRSKAAAFWIPDEDQWYKAAFYHPEKKEKPYTRETVWNRSLAANRTVIEIVDPPLQSPDAPLEAVAERTAPEEEWSPNEEDLPAGEAPSDEEAILFANNLPPELPDTPDLEGFRIATEPLPEEEAGVAAAPEGPDGKGVLDPVGEGPGAGDPAADPVGEGPLGSPVGPAFLTPGFLTPAGWPVPIIVNDAAIAADDDEPAS